MKNTDISELMDIGDLYSSLESILEYINKTNPTAGILLNDLLRRVIIIAAVSEFESRITSTIGNMKVDNIKIKELVKKFTNRQFWNMFSINENERNINHFLSYFGEDFKESISSEIKKSDELTQGMLDFIELVKLRNELSHKGFLISDTTLPLTYRESFDWYKKAKNLVDFIEQKLLE